MPPRQQVEDFNPYKAIQPTQQLTDNYIEPGYFQVPQNEWIDIARSLSGLSQTLSTVGQEALKAQVEGEIESGIAQVDVMTEDQLDSALSLKWKEAGLPAGSSPLAQKRILSYAGAKKMRLGMEQWGTENFLRFTDPENREDVRAIAEEAYSSLGIQGHYAEAGANKVYAEFVNNYVSRVNQSRIKTTEARLKEDHYDGAYNILNEISSTPSDDQLADLEADLRDLNDSLYNQSRIQAPNQVANAALKKSTELAKSGQEEAARDVLGVLEKMYPQKYTSEIDSLSADISDIVERSEKSERNQNENTARDFSEAWFADQDPNELAEDPMGARERYEAALSEEFPEDEDIRNLAIRKFTSDLRAYAITEQSDHNDLRAVQEYLLRPDVSLEGLNSLMVGMELTPDDVHKLRNKARTLRDQSREDSSTQMASKNNAIEAARKSDAIFVNQHLKNSGLNPNHPDVQLILNGTVADLDTQRSQRINTAIAELINQGMDPVEAANQVAQNPPELDVSSLGNAGEFQKVFGSVQLLETMARTGRGSEKEFHSLLMGVGQYSDQGTQQLEQLRSEASLKVKDAFESDASGFLIPMKHAYVDTLFPDSELGPDGAYIESEPKMALAELEVELGVVIDDSIARHNKPGVTKSELHRLVISDIKKWREESLRSQDPSVSSAVDPQATTEEIASEPSLRSRLLEPTFLRNDSDFLALAYTANTTTRPDRKRDAEEKLLSGSKTRIKELLGVNSSSDVNTEMMRRQRTTGREKRQPGVVWEWKEAPEFLEWMGSLGENVGRYETGKNWLKYHYEKQWNVDNFGTSAVEDMDVRTTEYLFARSLSDPLSIEELEGGYAKINGVDVVELPADVYSPTVVRFFKSPEEVEAAQREWEAASNAGKDKTVLGRLVLVARRKGQKWPGFTKGGDEIKATSVEAFAVHQRRLLSGNRRKN